MNKGVTIKNFYTLILNQIGNWWYKISKKEKEYLSFMLAISIILLITGTIILIGSAFGAYEFGTSGFIIGLIIVFTGLGTFLYTIIFK